MEDNQKEKADNEPKKTIRTYAEDMARVITEKGGEAIRLARIEHKEKEESLALESRKLKMNIAFAIFSGILLLGGIVFLINSNKNKAVLVNIQTTAEKSIIFPDNQEQIDITELSGEKVLNLIRKETGGSASKNGQITEINPAEKTNTGSQKIYLDKFFSILKIDLPENLKPFIQNKFMFGFYSNGQKWPFLILKTDSFQNASSGLLDWEKYILDDLFKLFNIKISDYGANIFGTKFEDGFINNKDIRILKDENGKIALMYLFLDEQTILITQNSDLIAEALLRLYTSQIIK